MNPSLNQRSAGLLLHPTSLPGIYPIGDIGPSAYRFIDFLAKAWLHWWQMLPLSPIGLGNSPYQPYSSFAANTLLVSPERLWEEGWLPRLQKTLPSNRPPTQVHYELARTIKEHLFAQAFQRFESSAKARDREMLDHFVHDQRSWLPDYALFISLHNRYQGQPWWTWGKGIRQRHPTSIREAQKALYHDIRYEMFMQWQFARQWEQLRDYGKKRGIGFIGDMPIFVSADSADAWAHPDLFTLHHDGTPKLVAGVPPDYFSKTGQLWGNPHYRWDRMKRDRYAWWVERFKTVLRYFNVVRIDHFIGFVRYYAIPAGAKDATSGQYKAGPGAHFFHTVLKQLNVDGKNALIAEDLGTVTPEVKQLRDQFELPGMKVLQFAFGTDPEALNYQPHNYPHHCIVYTGTHDNNTTLGWFREEASKNPREKDFTLRYLNSNGRQIHWDMIRAAMASPGATVIIPVQDILGLGSRSRMNFPGKSTGNWEWRILPHALTSSLAGRIRDLTEIYQRQL